MRSAGGPPAEWQWGDQGHGIGDRAPARPDAGFNRQDARSPIHPAHEGVCASGLWVHDRTKSARIPSGPQAQLGTQPRHCPGLSEPQQRTTA